MRASFAALAALTGVASAGMSTVAYTDSKTEIDFQQFTDADSGFAFGVALPKIPGKDFIGQIVAPGSGWGGVSLTSSMMASVLIAAWPNGEDVVGTVRKTNSYVSPSVDSSGPALYPIEKGSFVNSTHYSYTFLCKNCITGDSDSFKTSTATAVLGWALSDTAPNTPSSASSVLKYHSTGFGEFGLKVADAESANYATWAKMASTTTASAGGNGTTTTNGTTSSTPASTPLPSPITLNTTYDYIIVGAGDAGIVVAERLAESSASVLLIERGGKSMASTGGTDKLSWNSSLTPYDVPGYGYAVEDTADTSYCTDTASTAGCILGGSTMINAEMFVPPQEADFENWPQGWQWSDIQESATSFYERNPGSTKPSADGQRYFQGTFSIISSLLKGNGWSEVDAIEQPNKKHMVYSHPPMNIVNSTRAGPVLTYLPLAEQYKNFKLQLNTKVLRVVRSGSSVSGVEIQLSSGQTEIVPLSKNGKVILAAGALSTPRLLINSGIGPQDQIETVNKGTSGISVNTSDIIELPVGKSLKDHPIFTISVRVSSSNITVFDATAPTTDQIALYAQGSGPLAEGMQRLNFWSSVEGSDGVTRFVQGTVATASASSIKIKVYLTHGLTSEGVLGMSSDGSTTFITKPWLTTEADKAAITTFLTEFIAYINKSGSFKIDSTTGGNVTAADLISNYVTGDHFVGTAKMGTDDGRENNGTAVVDTDCKVYGTDNLYVVDASIHPDLPTGNSQAIVAVIAEHAAKVISGATGGSSGTVSSGYSSGSASSARSTRRLRRRRRRSRASRRPRVSCPRASLCATCSSGSRT
ncbi:GMC oxidoreductase [Phyllosticta citriasiana]|uniref:GMC oxidoreductase n=1 Tax=Phyllosticta citriasiana TaxID=595635 RepID=UPI0030FD51A1